MSKENHHVDRIDGARPLEKRLARTLTSRSSAAGQTSVFLSVPELRAFLAMAPDADLIELDRVAARIVSAVRVRDVERRLEELAPLAAADPERKRRKRA